MLMRNNKQTIYESTRKSIQNYKRKISKTKMLVMNG